jgi:hypothetical protein
VNRAVVELATLLKEVLHCISRNHAWVPHWLTPVVGNFWTGAAYP